MSRSTWSISQSGQNVVDICILCAILHTRRTLGDSFFDNQESCQQLALSLRLDGMGTAVSVCESACVTHARGQAHRNGCVQIAVDVQKYGGNFAHLRNYPSENSSRLDFGTNGTGEMSKFEPPAIRHFDRKRCKERCVQDWLLGREPRRMTERRPRWTKIANFVHTSWSTALRNKAFAVRLWDKIPNFDPQKSCFRFWDKIPRCDACLPGFPP